MKKEVQITKLKIPIKLKDQILNGPTVLWHWAFGFDLTFGF